MNYYRTMNIWTERPRESERSGCEREKREGMGYTVLANDKEGVSREREGEGENGRVNKSERVCGREKR